MYSEAKLNNHIHAAAATAAHFFFLNLRDGGETRHTAVTQCGPPSERERRTHLEPPGRFLSRPRRFLSAKEGLRRQSVSQTVSQ